jgi:predicted  nucleic acid-binding Zn-ribbon protein
MQSATARLETCPSLNGRSHVAAKLSGHGRAGPLASCNRSRLRWKTRSLHTRPIVASWDRHTLPSGVVELSKVVLPTALSVILQFGALEAPASAANLTAQGRGTAAELENILAQRGARLPALTSSPNEPNAGVESNMKRGGKGGPSRELVQELRRQSREIQELKAELQGTVPGKSTSSSQDKAVALEESAGSSTLSVVNVFGIFAAAGLGGYVTLQKKDAQEAEVAFTTKIEAEQGVVKGLQEDFRKIQNLLSQEKNLVEKIKQESATASSEYARQLSLEKASKEAVERERRLVEQSLSSEQRLAEALRLEAEKTNELLEAEKAAKFAADAEASQLQAQLAQVQEALAEEKLQVQKWQSEMQDANQRLSEAKSANEALQNDNSALEDDLEERAARIAELNAAAAALQEQIENAAAVNASQGKLIERIGKDTLNMQEAMSVMRAQAAERALAAHNEREVARIEREQYETEANIYREQIAEEQQTIERLESELSDAKQEIQRANSELSATKEELVKAQRSLSSMEQEIEALSEKVSETEKALVEEQGVSSSMRMDNVNLRSELASLQSEISTISSNLASERADKAQLLEAMETLKEEYNQMSEHVESEQNTVASLRKEAGILKKTIAELETKNRTLGSNLVQVEEQNKAKLVEVEKRLLDAEKNAGSALSSRDDAVAAIDKLENVINMLQEDMQESQAFALAAQAEVESERAARSSAESSLEEMQSKLRLISKAEEQARVDVQEQLAELRSEYDAAMSKLKELTQQKAAPKKRAAKKELTEEEKEAKKRAAVEKRRATMARKKAEKEAAEKEAAEKEAAEKEAAEKEAAEKEIKVKA